MPVAAKTKCCHSERLFYGARNLLLLARGNSRFLHCAVAFAPAPVGMTVLLFGEGDVENKTHCMYADVLLFVFDKVRGISGPRTAIETLPGIPFAGPETTLERRSRPRQPSGPEWKI